MKVKALDAEEGRVGGYLVIWGNRGQHDLQGEYFTEATELGLDWYPQRPVLYQHGQDTHLKSTILGVIDRLHRDEIGLWAEAQLNVHQRYVRAVMKLIDRGILSWSSGSLPHLVEVADDGCIKQWPIVEGSLTPSPAEPRRTDVRTIKSAYGVLGLDVGRLGLGKHDRITGDTMEIQNDNTSHRKRLPVANPQDAMKTTTRLEVTSPYDDLEAMDLLHGYMMMRAGKSFRGASERYANALADKVVRGGLTATKATGDLSGTIVTGFGDDWVPDLWSSEIWKKARQDNVILPLFRQIEMPSNPFELPIEGADPSVYFVPETTQEAQLSLGSGNPIPESKVGSGKVQLNAGKLALRVGFSAELVEDAIVPVLNIYREQAVRAIADSIDFVLLNGDTEGSNAQNINTDQAAPQSTDRFMIFDGLRKLPLVTAVANSVLMGDVPTLAKMRETRFKMASKYAARPGDLAWIVDGGTYAQLLGLEQFLTMDKAGAQATAMTGQIGFVDGIPVLLSAEMPLTNVDGAVTLGETNDKGTALCVYRPGWVVGYRRRIGVSVDYLPYYDAYQMTATVRVAFANFDDDVASVLHNVTV